MKSFILITILLSSSIYANCELSHVQEWSAEQNWMHTVAYRSSARYLKANIIKKTQAEFSFKCKISTNPNKKCPKFKIIKQGKKEFCKKELKDSVTFGWYDEHSQRTINYFTSPVCKEFQMKEGDIIFHDNNEGKILIPKTYPLEEKNKKVSKRYIQWFKQVPNVKKIVLSEYYLKNEFDITKGKLKSIKEFVHPKFRDIKFIEARYLHRLSTIPGACIKKCLKKNKSKILDIPVIFIKRKGKKLSLFATPAIGKCSAYNEIHYERHKDLVEGKLNKAELMLLKKFGSLTRFTFYDVDHDGIMEIMSVSTRKHLYNHKQFYYVDSDGRFQVGDSLCLNPEGKLCFPE